MESMRPGLVLAHPHLALEDKAVGQAEIQRCCKKERQ